MQDFQHSFAARGIERGGTLYLKASDALDFIEAARLAKMPVMGVDAFIITETATEPLLEHILDCSIGGLPPDTWSPARRFVEERLNLGFMFEIVV
jgi:hypothetical protein